MNITRESSGPIINFLIHYRLAHNVRIAKAMLLSIFFLNIAATLWISETALGFGLMNEEINLRDVPIEIREQLAASGNF